MAISDLQKKSAQAIVNIFETGRALGDYGSVTLLPGDTGHLTYGRSQTTLASGNLALLVSAYVGAPGAAFGGQLAAFLPRLAATDLSLDGDAAFRALLRRAGDDPVMHEAQDGFFDRVYWAPAAARAQSLGLKTALGVTTIYDSTVHGSLKRIVDEVLATAGSVAAAGEEKWVARFVEARAAWLGSHANPLLRKTTYRMQALDALIQAKKWSLPLPLRVRGVTIDESVLAGVSVRASAEGAGRILRLAQPLLQGDDVKALQRALKRALGAPKLDADGIFGPATELALLRYQRDNGLTVDGIAGPATRSRLKLDR
ncbi:MAG TPA: peptidoglycan-binding protein [Myxococcota bacterium]